MVRRDDDGNPVGLDIPSNHAVNCRPSMLSKGTEACPTRPETAEIPARSAKLILPEAETRMGRGRFEGAKQPSLPKSESHKLLGRKLFDFFSSFRYVHRFN